jgi:very-short-patch-repair endonuclease
MTVAVARALRRRLTDAERTLWRHLRDRATGALKFRRQQPIGAHIADFACWNGRLVVEVDGGQHNAAVDTARTAAIEAAGWMVLRVWNNDVLANTAGVLETILAVAQARVRERQSPSPCPSP